MGMFECEIKQVEGFESDGEDFPTWLTCDIGVVVLELEFSSWSAADGFAWYRDTNSHQEHHKVFNNDGKLVADVRED